MQLSATNAWEFQFSISGVIISLSRIMNDEISIIRRVRESRLKWFYPRDCDKMSERGAG